MNLKTQFQLGVAFAVLAVLSAPELPAATIVIDDDSTWTQEENGFFTASNNGLNAEFNDMWGLTNNANNRQGLIYKAYSDAVSGSGLPSTLQAGSYTLEARIGTNGQGGNDWIGLNDMSTGTNTVFGAVAGFFSTPDGANATNTKNNMFAEFIDVAGVTYSVAASDPADDTFTTWTFSWDITPGSSVIGSNPNIGFYVKTGNGGGNAFWDNSRLNFTPIPEPTTVMALSVLFGACSLARWREFA